MLDDAARIPALQNNAIDATGLASLDELTVARKHGGHRDPARPGPQLVPLHLQRRARVRSWPTRRCALAVAKGIDRQAIANVTQRGLVDNPAPLNNHIYVAGQDGYQDNSQVVAYDPEKAKQELDALGWKMNGQFREKDGKQLVIRDVLYDSQSTRQVGQIAQNSLAQIGVKLELDAKSGDGFFSQLHHRRQLRHRPVLLGRRRIPAVRPHPDLPDDGRESNFGKIGSPEIDAKIERRCDELDPDKARDTGQRARQADLGRGIQPAAVPVAWQRRRAQQPGELRRPRASATSNYTTIGFMK